MRMIGELGLCLELRFTFFLHNPRLEDVESKERLSTFSATALLRFL